MSNNISGIFGNIFGRKEVVKPATPEERSAKLLKSYQLEVAHAQPLQDKLTSFEKAKDEASAQSEVEIKLAKDAIEAAEASQKAANDVVNAAKAVGLRMVTLSKEIKAAQVKAEEAKAEAQAKVEALTKSTEDASNLGNQLIAGLTNPMLTVDLLAQATEEEINALFGSSSEVKAPAKAADVKIV